MNMCKTEDTVLMAEAEGLLPPNHFGGRPGRATTDSIHLVVKTIKDTWRKHEVASVLFLDVKGAFPSVAIEVLAHELRMRGVPKEHVEWVKRRNEGRKTTLVFDDHRSKEFEVENGLDQGDAQSLILYILYNAGILAIPIFRNGEWAFIFVDDVALAVTCKTFDDTHAKLKGMMEREKGIFQWAKEHNCEFGIEKFQLLDASRQTEPNPVQPQKRIPIRRPPLMIGGHRLKPQPYVKFLGVLIDQGLNWKEQGAAALARGAGWLAQFRRIARPKFGVSNAHMHRLYLSTAVPRMLYAADIFLMPTRQGVTRSKVPRGGQGVKSKLASIQGQAAVVITGGMRTSPRDAAEAHVDIIPFSLLVDKVRQQAAARLATMPGTHPLHKAVKSAAARNIKRH